MLAVPRRSCPALEAWPQAASRVSVAGYGAPAKGNTLLGFLEIGPGLLPYIVYRSPLKQGLYTPGTHIPIVAPERRTSEYLGRFAKSEYDKWGEAIRAGCALPN